MMVQYWFHSSPNNRVYDLFLSTIKFKKILILNKILIHGFFKKKKKIWLDNCYSLVNFDHLIGQHFSRRKYSIQIVLYSNTAL